MSKRPACAAKTAGSLVAMNPVAPSASASSRLPGEWLSTVTRAPIAAPIFTATWPRPPRPTTASSSPRARPKCLSGEYVVMPAHSSGAARSSGMPSGMRST